MNKVKYIPYAVFIALLLIALAVCKYQDGIIFDLRKANQGLTVDIAQAEYRMRQAQAAVAFVKLGLMLQQFKRLLLVVLLVVHL